MLFGGMQKLTTLDFPGVVSALVFTQGCNFHCPYCHNAQLIPLKPLPGADPVPSEEDVLAFLHKRADVLDGLVISGGEPLMQPDIREFCREVKALGYKIKLDTNGSFPERLDLLLAEDIPTYVAVDVKAAPSDYAPDLCADSEAGEKLGKTLALLAESGVPHETRTTCVAPFISPEAVRKMGAAFSNQAPWLLQKASVDDDSRLRALSGMEMAALLPLDPRLSIRG